MERTSRSHRLLGSERHYLIAANITIQTNKGRLCLLQAYLKGEDMRLEGSWGWECLPYNHEDPNLIPRTHGKSQVVVHTCT